MNTSDTSDPHRSEPPRQVADLPTESVCDVAAPVPVVTNGQMRDSRTTPTLLRDIHAHRAMVLLKERPRGQFGPERAAEALPVPSCFILATALWESLCEVEGIQPAAVERYGATRLRNNLTRYYDLARAGTHVVVETRTSGMYAWSATFVPLEWGQEALDRGLVQPVPPNA